LEASKEVVMATSYEFVRTDLGWYLLQVFDWNRWPKHGFALYDGETFWPGGLGLAENWEVVEYFDVPEEVRLEMMRSIKKHEWVKTALGQYMMLIRNWSRYPRSGYGLFDGKRTYPDGHGIHVGWKVVPPEEVPETIKRELELTCEELGE
jgi:hypothetical protein